jgi:hypothetical protein
MMGHQAGIQSLCFTEDGHVISAGGDEGIFIWNFLGFMGRNDRHIELGNHTQSFK